MYGHSTAALPVFKTLLENSSVALYSPLSDTLSDKEEAFSLLGLSVSSPWLSYFACILSLVSIFWIKVSAKCLNRNLKSNQGKRAVVQVLGYTGIYQIHTVRLQKQEGFSKTMSWLHWATSYLWLLTEPWFEWNYLRALNKDVNSDWLTSTSAFSQLQNENALRHIQYIHTVG